MSPVPVSASNFKLITPMLITLLDELHKRLTRLEAEHHLTPQQASKGEVEGGGQIAKRRRRKCCKGTVNNCCGCDHITKSEYAFSFRYLFVDLQYRGSSASIIILSDKKSGIGWFQIDAGMSKAMGNWRFYLLGMWGQMKPQKLCSKKTITVCADSLSCSNRGRWTCMFVQGLCCLLTDCVYIILY